MYIGPKSGMVTFGKVKLLFTSNRTVTIDPLTETIEAGRDWPSRARTSDAPEDIAVLRDWPKGVFNALLDKEGPFLGSKFLFF